MAIAGWTAIRFCTVPSHGVTLQDYRLCISFQNDHLSRRRRRPGPSARAEPDLSLCSACRLSLSVQASCGVDRSRAATAGTEQTAQCVLFPAQGPPGMVITLGVSPLMLPALLCGPAASNIVQEAGAGGEEIWNNGCFGTVIRPAIDEQLAGVPPMRTMAPAQKGDIFLEQPIVGRPGTWRPPRESESSEASDADFCVGKLGSGRQRGPCDAYARGQYLPGQLPCSEEVHVSSRCNLALLLHLLRQLRQHLPAARTLQPVTDPCRRGAPLSAVWRLIVRCA